MGALTPYLQREFVQRCPPGWSCRPEAPLLSPEWIDLLGYAPYADVLLERTDGSRRLWIEFEVSRADPVANHAKFATAHLFQPQPATDAFVAMVSSHVVRGRRNLAANTVALMRHVGMQAFQTLLLPDQSPLDVKTLNSLAGAALAIRALGVEAEIERALSVSEPVLTLQASRVHLAGDLLDVMLNVRQWNRDIQTGPGARLWGKRTITYFVYDRRTQSFAPSKFCAYLEVSLSPDSAADAIATAKALMTVSTYAALDADAPSFDGHRAQDHLTRRLSMHPVNPAEAPAVMAAFEQWADQHREHIRVSPAGPMFLLAPPWFS